MKALTTDDPHFTDTPGVIAIPFEGAIGCPHCNRSHNGRLVVHASERQAYDLVSRLHDLLTRSVARRNAMEAIGDHKKHRRLTH